MLSTSRSEVHQGSEVLKGNSEKTSTLGQSFSADSNLSRNNEKTHYASKQGEVSTKRKLYIKKNCRLFPSDMSLGKIPLKDKTLEVKSVEKSNSKGLFPSDMSLGKILPPWHQFLDQKIRGAHFSLGIVAGERFAIELTPSTFLQRHFAGDMFPQRHVAGEKIGMLLGKASNVVVLILEGSDQGGSSHSVMSNDLLADIDLFEIEDYLSALQFADDVFN
ncbi:hypothetical protein Tco_0269900 [Tanacetum coccineum]